MKLLNLFSRFYADSKNPVRPYIIAEAGVNHAGDLKCAKRLIEEAKEGGANAIKFQTYKAETLASVHSQAYWDTKKETTESQFSLFKKYDKFWKKEFEMLKSYSDKVGIEFMSTPFDIESAKFLNDLMDVYKISSSDITNKPFVKFICGFGKPIILSTGASNLCEVQEAVGWIEETGNPTALLHCVLNYPTNDKNANIAMITGLKKAFPDKLIGYSDHTLPQDMKNLEVAFLLGAVILEKHFTFDKTLQGNDHYHAMDKEDLEKFIKNLNCLLRLLGKQEKQSLACEQPARQNARRSLVARHFISKGKAIKTADLTWKRPALGISPRQIDQVIGLRVKRDIKEDDILKWRDLKD